MSATYRAGPAVLRVCRPTADASCALALARLADRAGVRVARPWCDEVLTDGGGRAVTAWERIDVIEGAPADWVEVGRMVARVHALDPTVVRAVHPLDPLADLPWWRFDPDDPELPPELASVLHEHAGWRARVDETPAVVCHGDVHPHNVVVDADGPVLIDWDLVGLAPRAWDHAPLLGWVERWGGDPGWYPAFADGYGTDLRSDPLTAELARLRLLAATVMRVRAGRTDPAAAAEAQRRLRWWRGDPAAPTWQVM
jgi:Ser/Thr protein kinase RdoA (MazF antagonist)